MALDYQSVTVIIDATAAATPEIHVGMQFMSSITSASFIQKGFLLLKWGIPHLHHLSLNVH